MTARILGLYGPPPKKRVIPKPNVTKLAADLELSRWCAVLSSVAARVDEVPPGWFTVAQIAKAKGKSADHVRDLVRALRREGKAEARKFRVQLGQRIQSTTHYRLK